MSFLNLDNLECLCNFKSKTKTLAEKCIKMYKDFDLQFEELKRTKKEETTKVVEITRKSEKEI